MFKWFLSAAIVLAVPGLAWSTAARAELLTPTAASASSQNNEWRGPEHTIDNSNLSGPPYDLSSTHTLGEDNVCWQSNNEINGAWIALDLGNLFDLQQAHVWNYAQSNTYGDYDGRSIRNIDVYVSSTDTANYSSAVFTQAIDNHIVEDRNAPGPVTVQSFNLPAANVRWVKFVVDGGKNVGNYGDDTRVGLFEVKFSGTPVPEPGTTTLISMGAAVGGLLVLRRRKK